MYLYEEMNLDELLDDPEIDPDSADALYAIAQCYRLGKGTDVNEELYRSNLDAAAQAGSEAARQELAQSEPAKAAPAADTSVEDLPLYQQRRLADEGNPAAILQMAYNSLDMNDAEAALSYLQRAEKHVGESVYTPEEEQTIFLELGELFAKAPLENPQKSAHYYGLAHELGSAQAALVLFRYARDGYGCTADTVQADTWMRRAAESGDPEVQYDLALEIMSSQTVYACSLLDEVAHSAEDEELRTCAKIILDARKSGTIPLDELDDAWSVCDRDEITTLLVQTYNVPTTQELPEPPAGMVAHPLRAGRDGFNLLTPEGESDHGTVNGLPITANQAESLAECCANHDRRRLWLQCAAVLGSETAAQWIEGDDLCAQALQMLQKNPQQANTLLQRAAELGSVMAAYQLGISFYNGTGVAKNLETAAHWIRTAAEGGFVEAMYGYAQFCLPGTPDSNPEKRHWMERAADCDSVKALYALCSSRNPGSAPLHLTRLAESGSAAAQYFLARCHIDGLGVPKDSALCTKWFLEAVRTRPEGQYDLKRDSKIQYAFATANIADNMLVSDNRDDNQAFHWASEAYKAHQEAVSEMSGPATICFASILGNCYTYGVGTPVDYSRALECYRSVDEHYEYAAPAWLGIGRSYLFGWGVERDLAQARAYIEKAQQGGYAVSQDLLNQLVSAENAQQHQRAEVERQASFDHEFVQCARCLLAFILVAVFGQVFRIVHVPFVGSFLLGVLSLAQLVLLITVGVKCYSLYSKTKDAGFGSRLGKAFVSECSAFGQAFVGLFSGSSNRKSSGK